jgi:phage shock protein A
MGLIDRFTTLVRADAHGVVDALEDRALLLRQHLRDAADELDRKRTRLLALEAEERDLDDELRRLGDEIRALDEDVELALAGGKEDLARFAVGRLLPLQHRRRRVEERLTVLRRRREELAEGLAAQEEAYAELEGRVRGHLARLAEAGEARPEGGFHWIEPPVSDEEVELELLRRRGAGERREGGG